MAGWQARAEVAPAAANKKEGKELVMPQNDAVSHTLF
jgi:hypothetical protein